MAVACQAFDNGIATNVGRSEVTALTNLRDRNIASYYLL